MTKSNVVTLDNERCARQWNKLLCDAHEREDWYKQERDRLILEMAELRRAQDAKHKSFIKRLLCAFSVVWRSAWRL